ncbi:MAG TPA: DUF3052 domain-containing protein [Corynebacterium sp.]|nr:DUF3052 domain-containing protein [Corynebacterium sp.]
MVDAPGAINNDNAQDYVQRLGIKPDMIVQEIGWDEDCDSSLSEAVEDAIGEELVDYDTDELVDTVLLWFREEDGDLVDALVDATRSLAPEGDIWLLTPGAGKTGTVAPGEINESAQLAGLVGTTAERFGAWQASLLVTQGGKK